MTTEFTHFSDDHLQDLQLTLFTGTAKMYACLYFDSDKSVSVLPKSKCKLKSGQFEPRNEVDVDWRDGRGRKERLLATVLKVGDKGRHKFSNSKHFLT